MATYLSGGWYDPAGGGALHDDVVEGAMDVAGSMLRAGVGPRLMTKLALAVRKTVTLSDPQMAGTGQFDARARSLLERRIEPYVTQIPELDGFMADCLEHVGTPSDLFALYLHLVHITRMLQLLGVAMVDPATKKRKKKLATKKRKKKPATKKRKKKPATKKRKKKPATKKRKKKPATKSTHNKSTKKKSATKKT